MNNELQEHKKSDTVKWILTLIAFILVGVLLLGIILGWFEKKEPTKEAQPSTAQTGGMIVGEEKGNGIALLSSVIAMDDYESYGISPQAETAYTLTASIENEEWTDGKIDWSIAWSNTSSWATENPISTYLKIQPTTSGAKTATLTLQKGGFHVSAIVTVALHSDSSIKATCTVDYLRRPSTYSFYTYNTGSSTLYQNGFKIGEETWLNNHTDKGVDGTVDGTFDITSVTLEVNEQYLWSAVRSNRYFKAGLKTLGMQSSAFVPKTSIPVTVSSQTRLSITSLTGFFTVNGNGAFCSYVENAMAEVMKGYSGSTNIALLRIKGTYGSGDVSVDFTESVGITHFVLDSYHLPSVTIPASSVGLDVSSILF